MNCLKRAALGARVRAADHPLEVRLDSTPSLEVGIVYLVGGKLWIDSTPVARSTNVGGYMIHERDHHVYWKWLVKQIAVPDIGYDRYPRGRVSYSSESGKFTFLADRCILRQKMLVATIFMRMHIPDRDAETGADRLYRCFRCLGRSPLSAL